MMLWANSSKVLSQDKLRLSRNNSKDLKAEKTTTAEDINEEGDDFKSKERIEVHDS